MKINIRQILKKLPYTIGAVAILLSGILHYHMHLKDRALISLGLGLLLILSYLLGSTVFNKKWRHDRDIRVRIRRAARSMRIPRKPWFERSGWPWNWNWSGFFKATGISKIFFWQWRWKAFFTKVGNYTIFNPSRWRKSVVLKSIVVALAIAAAFVVEKHWANTTYAVGAFVLVILGTTVIYYAVYYMAVFVKYVAKNYASWKAQTRQNIQNMSKKTVNRLVILGLATVSALAAYWYGGSKYAIGVFVSIILLAIILSFGSKIASYLSNIFRGNTNNQNNIDGPVLEFLNEKDERLYYFLVWLEILLVPIILCVGIFIFSYYTLGWLSIVGFVLTAYIAFRNAGKKLEENPVDEFMMLTFFGRPLAFMRHGGPYMRARFLTEKHSGSVEIIPIVFGKEAAKRGGESTPADEIACNCATKNQSVLYEKEYVKVFDNADYKPTGVTGQQAYDAAKAAGEINDGQVTLKPEFNIVLRIGVFEKRTVVQVNGNTEIVDFGLENIRNYFKNIPGETAEARKKYIVNQLREDIRSSINTELKKYSYSMLCLMITTNGLDKVFKNQIETLIDEQGLGLQIDTLKMTALGASEAVHKAQEDLFAANFAADSAVIKAKGDANAAKETALGEKEKLKLEGQGKAEAFKEMAKEELASIANTMVRLKTEAGDDEALLAKIVEWEYKLEEMKLLSGSKSIVITNAGGSGDSSGAQTALLIQAINDLKAEITKK